MELETDDLQEGSELSRAPTEADLVELCRRLNDSGARYMIVGGLAVMYAGYARSTMDVDMLMDVSPENEAKVFAALDHLPDKAVRELKPGDVNEYTVVRVGDEITIDLMKSASGIDYAQAEKDVLIRNIQGVSIPFASPRLLWRMKKATYREKDAFDLIFLRQQYPEATQD